METKKHSSSLPAGFGRGRTKTTQRSRWLGLLIMFVFAFFSQTAKAANAWEWPKFSAKDVDVTPDNPFMAFEVSYLNYDGNNFYWRTFNLVVDGVDIGSIGSLMSLNSGTNDDPINWNTKKGWIGNYWVEINGFWQGDGKWKYMKVNVYIPNSTYGQTHTVGIKGAWVDKDRNVRNITPDNLKITSNAVTFTTPSGCGSYERTAPQKITWRPSNSVTAASGYSHKYEYRLNDAGNWITNSNPNANYVLSGVNDYEQQTYHTRYVQYKSYTQANRTITVSFTRDWQKTESGNIIKACVAPKELETTFDQWKKTTTLKWKKNDSNCLTNGKFYLFRYKNGDPTTREKLGVFNYGSSLQYVDDTPEYDNQYVYEVSSILDTWSNSAPVVDLTVASEAISTEPKYNFTAFTDERKESCVRLSWSHDMPSNNTAVKFKVWRCMDSPSFYDQEGHAIEDNIKAAMGDPYVSDISASTSGNVTSYEDYQIGSSCTTYYYRIGTDLFGRTFYSDVLGPTSIIGSTVIKNVTANRGTYTNVVKVQWDVTQVGTSPSRFVVYRRLLGSNLDEDYKQVHVVSGTESSYFFEDNTAQPGQFYQYRVVSQSNCVDNGQTTFIVTDRKETDGFCQSRGIISGRITYGTGTAVPDARVMLTKNSEGGDNALQFYSLKVSPQGGILWSPTASAAQGLFEGKAFTLQMYVRPDAVLSDGSTIIDGGGNFAVLLKPAAETGQSEVYVQVGSDEPTATGVTLTNGDFANLSVTCDGTTGWTVRAIDKVGNLMSQTVTAAAVTWAGTDGVAFGCDRGYTAEHAFTGYLDDIRLWSKALTDDDVMGNYDRLLIGTEADLKLYWPMDEGVAALPFAYDYSKTQGVANENHGQKQPNSAFSATIPSDTQLGLYGKTDTEGNYVIRGIPFTGEGTNYMVRPTMGIHEFSPKYQTRFINTEALTHSGVDFQDVSSFPVSGVIYYENTDYPVEGVNFYIDGTIVAQEGTPVETDANGHFTISVPIGDHHITVKKNGHTFVYDGRYPADPLETGLKHTFDREMTGLSFYDNTLVTVAGRVVGGDTEGDKPLGMALSTNNIGRAQVELSLQEGSPYRLNVVRNITGTVQSVDNNEDTLAVASPTGDVNSIAWRTGGTTASQVQSIIIQTDPATGEFAALLPPLLYKVKGITMTSPRATASFAGMTFSDIDATDPVMEYTDSTDVYNGTDHKEFTYNARLAQSQSTYHCTPTFEVTQTDRSDGLFGDDQVVYQDPLTGEETHVPAIENDGYKFGYPMFEQLNKYKFRLKGYEVYNNRDAMTSDQDLDNLVTTIVPLKNTVVTINNELSATRAVSAEEQVLNDKTYREGDMLDAEALETMGFENLAENQLQLDERGEVVYEWQAGFPNINDDLTRAMTITYDYNGRSVSWQDEAFKGIIIGALPSGSNFVTAGPDQVQMILRDPAGSGSSSAWEEGSSYTTTTSETVNTSTDNNVTTVTHFGLKTEMATGPSGLGVASLLVTTAEAVADMTVGIEASYSYDGNHSKSTTWTTSKTVSTSGAGDIEGTDGDVFSGANGDVFIGTSTNLVFGNARKVYVNKNASGNYEIASGDGLVSSTEYETVFHYSQYYIKNTLIPNLERLRDDLLITVDANTYNNYTNTTDEVKYITTLSPEDERFGSDNADKKVWGDRAVEGGFVKGPSYYAVKPANVLNAYQDMVQYYNESIRNWENQLALNEKHKVTVINNRDKYLINNYSFDSGTSIEASKTIEHVNDSVYTNSFSFHLVFGLAHGFNFNGGGVDGSIETNTGSGMTYEVTHEGVESSTFSYTLAESGTDDALSIDVFESPNGFGPIFVTRAGQTSCPYEGETLTEYYNPGTSIGAATMQIEKPVISVVDAKNVISDVPRGGKAVFQLKLENLSETNSASQFNLTLLEDSNPNSAQLSLSTGPLGNGHTFIVESGNALIVPLTLTQNNTDVYDYENIGLVLESDCDTLSDVVYISAHFVPSSSDVTLTADKPVLNTTVGDELTLKVRDYDAHYENLKAIRLQFKGERDANWSMIPGEEYVVSEQYKTEGNQYLPEGGVITVVFPMESYVDGTYLFRAQTATAYGADEITKESEEVTVIKDMKKPQLFGLASPSDGVLNAGDDISVTFNEDIRQSMLTETGNFKITAALNGQQVAHSVALDGQNTERAAYTETSINLAKKDFSTDMWVNYTGAGTLLSHGNGAEKLDVSTDASGHLVVKIGDETYTSGQTITPNKWVFLTLNYQYKGDGGVLNAMFAEDASQTMLFTDQNVAAYEGNGSLAVGKQMTGAIHELTLWDKARSCADAQAEMYYTKKPSTPNLIGYWKFDEGEGLTATDCARNRHMTLAEQTWYVNNENKAVTLSGSNALRLNISECSALSTEDYAMELWFKSNQSGAASLFSTGSSAQAVEMGFNASGALTLTSNGQTRELTATNYRDNAWHHLALNVLRSGNATVYVDGSPVVTMPASAVASLAGSDLVVGASKLEAGNYTNYFQGSLDEVRFWKATLTGDYLNRQKSTRLSGEEDGLMAYYPFEHKELDANQVVTTQSVADQRKVYNKTTEKYELTGHEATMTSGTVAFNANDVPRLKEAPTLTNIGFTFVANERSIVINLTDDADRLEGTTVDFVVKAVLDANGNESLPIHWTAYVKRNQLLWQGDNEVAIEQQSGESTTFEAVIVNESGQSENWTLSGLPTWLTASATSGTLTAQSKKTITFTVAESTAIGKYEQTIYLTGNNNISEPLTINLKVKGEEPDWTVNTSGYQFTMSIVGQLQFQGKLSTDEDDIVAAFNETGECVGVARPQYESAFDTYFTMMTVYGNNDGDLLTFKAYDASTGKVYPVVETDGDVFFEKDTRLGKLASPFIWNVTDKIEQMIDLKEGWNWMSLYVTPDNMNPTTVMADALDILNLINGPASTFEYDPAVGWVGTLTEMDNASMYKLNAKAGGQATVIGSPADVAATSISVKKEALTWIGYPPSFTLSPADAFAGLDPEEDDMVKSQSGFSVYSKANAKWVGTLKAMEPGKGYMYSSAATANKTFTYPSTAPAGGAAKVMAYVEPYDYHFTPVAPETYPGNMAVIGQVVENGLPVEGIEVAAFVDDECRATIVSDADGYLFLLVPGDGKARMMTLRAYILGDETALDLPLTYQADKKLGTLGSPVLIDITDLTTGIGRLREDAADGEYYDLSGRKLGTRPYQPGVYIRNGEKVVIKRK